MNCSAVMQSVCVVIPVCSRPTNWNAHTLSIRGMITNITIANITIINAIVRLLVFLRFGTFAIIVIADG